MGLPLRRRPGRRARRHARPARRQGRGACRDGQSRPAGAARLHHHHRGLHAISTRTKNVIPTDLRSQVDAALAEVGRITGRTFGDSSNPLLVSVRSGARASMPGMMDTVLNLGLNDATVEALAQASRRPALRLRFLSPLHHDVLRRGARPSPPSLRGDPRRPQGQERLHARHRSLRRRLGRAGSPLQAAARGRARRAVPAGPAPAVVGRDKRGVRLLDEPARHDLSAPAQHPGKLGHRGQCAGHGVRQHGRDLGDRRRLHAQSFDRRQAALRRVPDQRPGRGRGRRHPHPAGDHRGRAPRSRLRQTVDGTGVAAGVQGAHPHLRRARAPLPRHAGPRIHRRAGQAVDAANARGQAHRQGGAEDRGRARERGADHAPGGGRPHRSRRARPAAAPDHRSQRRAHGRRHRAARLARRGVGRDRVLGRRGGGAQGEGQERHPGAHRDVAGRHPRHARGGGHSHHPRRHDLARRRGGARHGQALRFRRRRAAGRLRRRHHERRRADVQARRRHHHRRLDRPGAGGPRAR